VKSDRSDKKGEVEGVYIKGISITLMRKAKIHAHVLILIFYLLLNLPLELVDKINF
jgi:hypothetical protein